MYLIADFFNEKELVEKVQEYFNNIYVHCQEFEPEVGTVHGIKGDKNNQTEMIVKDEDGIIGIVLTKKMMMGNRFLYNLEAARMQFERNEIDVVTVLVDLTPSELPQRLRWLVFTQFMLSSKNDNLETFCNCCAARILRHMNIACNSQSGTL